MYDVEVIGKDLVFVVSVGLFLVVLDDWLDVRLGLLLGEFVPIDPGKQIFWGLFEVCQIFEVKVLIVFLFKFLLGMIHVFVDIDQIRGIITVLLKLINGILTRCCQYLLKVGDTFFFDLFFEASVVIFKGMNVSIVPFADLDVIRAWYYVHHSDPLQWL